MKLIFTILLFLPIALIAQTTYYVSNSGSDANDGLTQATSWQTLHKVNISTFSNGDSILLKRGDVWNDSLIINHGQLNFGAYGTGVKPEITGFQSATMTNAGSNIWTGTLTNAPNHYFDTSSNGVGLISKVSLNTVSINDTLRRKARYPNLTQVVQPPDFGQIGTLTTAVYGTGWIKSDQSLTKDFTGSEIVIKTKNWLYDISKVLRQSGDTVFYTPATSYTLSGRINFFFQNLPSLADSNSEWAYNDSTKLLTVFSTTTPVVKYSTIDTLVNLHKYDSIYFSNIKFSGSNRDAIEFDSSDYISVINCSFDKNGFNTLQGYPSAYCTVSGDSLTNTLNNATRIFGQRLNINNSYFYNTATLAGMGGGGNGMNMAIYGGFPTSDSLKIQNNKIFKTGYIPIYFQGTKSLITNNYIDSFALAEDDGGGIDCFSGNTTGSLVRSNIITNGIGVGYVAPGIYLDYHTNGVTVDSNTIKNCNITAIHTNDNSIGTNVIINNTIVNSIGHGIYNYAGSNFTVKKNIIYLTNPSYYIYYATVVPNSNDSNYLISKSDSIVYNSSINHYYNLTSWQALGYDTHSVQAPSGITGANGVLYINPTISDSTISLSGLYYDAKSNPYNNSITLKPYTSALLFKASSEVPIVRSFRKIGGILIN